MQNISTVLTSPDPSQLPVENGKLVDQIGQFTTIPKSFIDSPSLSAHARWLFVVLRSYTNSESDYSFPSYDTLQERTRFRRAAISGALKELQQT